MDDKQASDGAQLEIWSVERQIKELNDDESYAVMKLLKHIAWLDAQPKRSQALETAKAAQRNLSWLGNQTLYLSQAYTDNAVSLDRDADVSVDLVKTNVWLSWCYFMISLSKVMDAIAQFYGGPAAKLITELKTPLADMARPAFTPMTPQRTPDGFGLSAAQTVNATLIGLQQLPGGKDILPGGVDPAAMQKEIAAIIEGVKDIAALCKRDPRSASGEFKLKLAVGAEKVAKLLDAANRALTLIDATPKIMPDAVRAKLPDRLGKSPFDKDALDKWKAYISAAKYLLEAIASFYQGCRSVSDTLESWSAGKEASSLAEKQLRPTGGGALDPKIEVFAHATQADLINILHGANSAADARQMSHVINRKIRELKAEIERLGNEQDRQVRFLEVARQRIAERKTKLRDSDATLERLRQALSSSPSALGETICSDYVKGETKRDVIARIDKTRDRIGAVLAPPAPHWIGRGGRLGPRVGPQ